MTPTELYILYGFLAFICLLLVTVVGISVRQSLSIGKLEGLIPRVDTIQHDLGDLREQLAVLREQVAEMRGILLGMNARIDLLMAHRHDDGGRVIIVPEEVAADD